MKKSTKTLLGLSLCALAPHALADEPTMPPPTSPAPEATAPAAPAAEPADTPAKPSDAEVRLVVSYFLGHTTGQQLASDGPGPISIDDIDKDVFFKALEDGMNNRVDPEVEKKDLRANLMAFAAKLEDRSKAASEKNTAASKAFFEENAKKEGVVTTKSGLQYKVLTPADGRTYNKEKDGEVSVTYEGRLLDGTVFDKSEKPISFPVTGVIPGFSEALQLMPVGAEWEVYIPSELGYGEHGPGILGSNAALIFKVKLHDIAPKKGSESNPIQLTPELLQQLQESGLQPMPAE